MKITSFDNSLETQAALQNAFNSVENGRFWHWERTYCLKDTHGQIHFVAFNILDRFILAFSFIEPLTRAYFGKDFAIALLPSLENREQLNLLIPNFTPSLAEKKRAACEEISDERACEMAKRGLIPEEIYANATHTELRSFAERFKKRFHEDPLGFISFTEGYFSDDHQNWIRHVLNFLLIKKEIGCFWHQRCGFVYCPNPDIQTLGDLLKNKVDFTQYPEDYFKEFTEKKGFAFVRKLFNDSSSCFRYLNENNRIAMRESIIDANDFKIIDDYRNQLKNGKD